jgi:hypothetical protein
MRRLWKGVLLGATVGAGVQAVRGLQNDGEVDGAAVARVAGEAAAAGALLGFLLDRRARRKQARLLLASADAKGIAKVVATAGVLAEAARPIVRSAAETAIVQAIHAAEVAKPHVQHAAEVAKPHVQHAADVAKPQLQHVADLAKERAVRAGGAAKAKLAELDIPVVVVA